MVFKLLQNEKVVNNKITDSKVYFHLTLLEKKYYVVPIF
jgi:hypothetical protein